MFTANFWFRLNTEDYLIGLTRIVFRRNAVWPYMYFTSPLLIATAVVRLWIVPKGYGDSVEPQQIGYVNVVPARNEFGVFDGFGDTVRKFNQHLRVHPLPGTWCRPLVFSNLRFVDNFLYNPPITVWVSTVPTTDPRLQFDRNCSLYT